MRNAFIQYLVQRTKSDKRIFLLTGDLGFGALEPFIEDHPENFLNAGIAEQNMIGVAAGLSVTGKIPFLYSIGNFPTFRCAEQIRNDIDYHNLPAVVVSVGAGVSYGALGYSHHAIQDIALMRAFPNMTILTPCDGVQVKGCLDYILENPTPAYLRLGKTGELDLTKKRELKPGECNFIVHEKNDTLVLALGTAAQHLDYLQFTNYDLATLPIWGQTTDITAIEDVLSQYKKVIIYEHHLKACGLYSWICENLKNRNLLNSMYSLSFNSSIIGDVGSDKYLIKKHLKYFPDH